MERRQFVAGGVTVLVGAIGVSTGTNVLADGHDVPITIVSIDPQTELIEVANEGDEDVDLSGYIVHYEWNRETDHEDTIPDGSVIEAGEQLTIDTGCTDLGGEIGLGDFGNCRFVNERAGVLALLSPGREVVDTREYEKYVPGEGDGESDDEGDAREDGADDDGQDEDDDGEPTEDGEPEDAFPRQYGADLSGEAHGVETDASGHAAFEVHDHDEGMDAHYELSVENICNVTQAHIHLGSEDEDGPVVAWLSPEEGMEPSLVEGLFSGMLAEGTITEDDLVGEWEGADFEAVVEAFEEQGAYVNVHTEEHPGGEIRGQIEPTVGL